MIEKATMITLFSLMQVLNHKKDVALQT